MYWPDVTKIRGYVTSPDLTHGLRILHLEIVERASWARLLKYIHFETLCYNMRLYENIIHKHLILHVCFMLSFGSLPHFNPVILLSLSAVHCSVGKSWEAPALTQKWKYRRARIWSPVFLQLRTRHKTQHTALHSALQCAAAFYPTHATTEVSKAAAFFRT